jgi:hypothetical protein
MDSTVTKVDVQQKHSEHVRELIDLELLLVGGGNVEVIIGKPAGTF